MTKIEPVPWQFWYTLIIVCGTLFVLQGEPMALLLGIPFNWLLYYVPVWLLIKVVVWYWTVGYPKYMAPK